MATNGPVPIQGCAYRLSRLNADGSIAVSAVGMVQDDRPLVKVELKPVLEAGTEITPKSACGVPVISYKDCDRYKRWDVTLTLGDWDPEQEELVANGSLITAPSSPGRTFNDGALTFNSNVLSSPSLANFLTTDVGRTVVGPGVPGGAYIIEFLSSTAVRLSAVATSDQTGASYTLGATPVTTIGYQAPQLLLESCPFGVSLEVWQKLIVRGTGYQGTTPYPSAGTPTIPGSAWLRTGIFRILSLVHETMSIEDKEQTPAFTGFAIENPNFGTGPADDWRVTATAGVGAPVPTTRVFNQMADFALPSPLQPGYQSTT